MINKILDYYRNADYDFRHFAFEADPLKSRFNEWIDYFKAGNNIFKNTEQMYVVGNNDLCPLDVYTLGVGDDLSKMNPINVEYFFTFELPYVLPTVANGKVLPSVYSFVYGDTYFLAMNSEVTDLARTNIFGDFEGSNLYNYIKT